MSELVFRQTWKEDLEAVRRLLSESELPLEDISGRLDHFLLALDNNAVVGCVGLEVYGPHGLLRSLAVAKPYRRQGIATALCKRIIAHARAQGVKQLYLLTTEATGFFKRQGFVVIDRGRAPSEIQRTEEFQTLCPSTAICMTRPIQDLAFDRP